MRTRLTIIAFILTATTSLGASDLWIHVRVVEDDHRPTRVEINLPLRMVERLAPMMDDYQRRDSRVHLGHGSMDARDLRSTWSRLQKGETVVEDDAILTLETGPRGQMLVVRERDDGDGSVVTVPADVVEALLSGPSDTFDLEAAVRALARHGEGELVSASEDDTTVRIWIDRDPEPRN